MLLAKCINCVHTATVSTTNTKYLARGRGKKCMPELFRHRAYRTTRIQTVVVAIQSEPMRDSCSSEQVSALGRMNCLKVLSVLVAAVRHPAPPLALFLAAVSSFSLASAA